MSSARRPPEPKNGADRAASLLARLAHRFADREAILWRGGLDEGRWSAMEAELLRDLEGAPPERLAEFAKAFVAARIELLRGALGPESRVAPTVDARISSAPQSTDEAAPTLPKGATDLSARFRSTAPLGTPLHGGFASARREALEREGIGREEGGRDAVEVTTDEDDALSATLCSGARATRSSPPTK